MIVISFLFAAVLQAVPLLFGTVGEIITQKVGNLNLGVEGMMCLGAIAGFMAGYHTDNMLLALLAAMAAAMAGALIYAFLTVSLKANQNVTGLTLTIFGTGFANYIGSIAVMNSDSGSVVLSDGLKAAFANNPLPALGSIPYIGRLLFSYNFFIYLAVAVAVIAGLYLNHTRRGLNMRAVGENPSAADAAGVPVDLYKYVHILAGGAICGLGGCYISMVTCGGVWTYNCVNGTGWIAVALVIFAGWSPYRAIGGSVVFGMLNVLRLYVPKDIIDIPNSIFAMLPFVFTCIVLIVNSAKKNPKYNQPVGMGVNYFREER